MKRHLLCRTLRLLLFVVVGPAVLAAREGAPAFEWRTTVDAVALVRADGAVVWQFNHPAAPAKPHFHPVALAGRAPLTWVAPPDHPWHLGLWFSWKTINGRNYWETDRVTGRSEGLTRVLEVRPETRADFSARIEADLAYQPDHDAAPVLREVRQVDISPPAADGGYHFDWTMTFTAGDEPVRLERTPLPGEPGGQPWGGYAGLIWRFAQEFTDWQVVNSAGERDQAAHGAPAAACDFSGRLGGSTLGVAMIDHARNPRAPTPWYVTLEPETPFACVMPAPLFREPIRLAPGESFTLRYRVIVHPGRWDAARLEAARAAYAGP